MIKLGRRKTTFYEAKKSKEIKKYGNVLDHIETLTQKGQTIRRNYVERTIARLLELTGAQSKNAVSELVNLNVFKEKGNEELIYQGRA